VNNVPLLERLHCNRSETAATATRIELIEYSFALDMWRLLVIGLVVVAFAGCGSSSGSDQSSSEGGLETIAVGTADEKPPAKPPIPVNGPEPKKKLVIKTVKTGSGSGLEKGDKFLINYRVFEYDDHAVVETHWGEEAFAWTIGIKEMVPALDIGMIGMKPGEMREIVAPAKFTYGNPTRIYVVERLT
jgi:FKBP-type peptidyl-prolyl cis-trans isomerase